MLKYRRLVPADRVRELVVRLIEERHYLQENGTIAGGSGVLSADTGVSDRAIRAITGGQKPSVSFSTLDKLLVMTGNHELSYLPPEEGGFLDYYQGRIPCVTYDTIHQRLGRLCRCGKELNRYTKGDLCFDCFQEEKRNNPRCADCGTQVKDKRAVRCRPCHFAQKRVKPSKASKKWIRDTKLHTKLGSTERLDSRSPERNSDFSLKYE